MLKPVIKAVKSDPARRIESISFCRSGIFRWHLGAKFKDDDERRKARGLDIPVIESVFLKNKGRNAIVRDRLEQAMGNLAGKTFAAFGVT